MSISAAIAINVIGDSLPQPVADIAQVIYPMNAAISLVATGTIAGVMVASVLTAPPAPALSPSGIGGSTSLGSIGGAGVNGGAASAAVSSPTYGFSGFKTSTTAGSTVPVIYGTHKAAGQFISLFTENENDNTVMYALIALSEGPITAISDIEINGQPIANYDGISTDQRLGAPGQSAIPRFSDLTAVTYEQSALISNGSYVTYTTIGANLNAVELQVSFTGGLFTIDSNNNLAVQSVVVTVDFKLHSAGSWTSGTSATYTEARRDVLRRTIRIDGLAPGQYDFRITRTTAQSVSLTTIDTVTLISVTEIVNDAHVFPNTALLAVSAISSNQLNGGTPSVSCIVQGVQVKVLTSPTAYSVAYSDNPAWVVFDILTNPRYGLGKFVWPVEASAGTVAVTNGSTAISFSGAGLTAATFRPGQKLVVSSQGVIGTIATINIAAQTGMLTQGWSGATNGALAYELHRDDLDLQSFINWASFCDTLIDNGAGVLEKRALCDFIFDQSGMLAWDAVNRICALARATPVKLGDYIRILVDQPATSVAAFSMANITQGTFKETFLSLASRCNYIEVQYLDASNNYAQSLVTIEDPLVYSNSEPIRKATISVYGVTRTSHAARIGIYHLLANRYITRTIEFGCGLDALNIEPGDLISFQHDVPQWGFATRASTGSGASSVVMDKAMTVVSGAYQVMVKHLATDVMEIRTVTNGPGTYTTLSIDTPWGTAPAKGDLVVFGTTGILTKPYRVVGVRLSVDLDVLITAVEYNPSIYDETGQLDFTILNYSALDNTDGPVPPVTNVTLLQPPAQTTSVYVSFTAPSDARYATSAIYQLIGGAKVLLGYSRNGGFPIEGLMVGETVTVYVQSLSVNGGVVQSLDGAPSASIVVRQSPPPDVTNFAHFYIDGHTRLTWNAVSWSLPVQYEVRVGSSWANAIVLGAVPYTNIDASGNGTYWVAALDSRGVYSANPISISVQTFRGTLGDQLTDNVVVTNTEETGNWPGTCSGSAFYDASTNSIMLAGAGLVDAIPDIDGMTDLWDFYGGVSTALGSYEIPASEIVDLGTAKACNVTASIVVLGDTLVDLIDSWLDVDSVPDIDGGYGSLVTATLMINIAQSDGVFTGYQRFVPGNYVGRKFQLRVDLYSLNPTVTPVLSGFTWLVDMPDRTDSVASNHILSAAGEAFTFNQGGVTRPFQIVPRIHIDVYDEQTGDYAAVTGLSVNGVTVRLFDKTNTGVSRTVAITAVGY